MAKPRKALFRFLLAFSNGLPVASFEVKEDPELGSFCAVRNSEVEVEVAFVRLRSSQYFEPRECPNALTAAYEIFIRDGEESSDVEWARLEEI